MKHLALLKSFAYLAFIIIAIAKVGSLTKSKKKTAEEDPLLNRKISGNVVKVLDEGSQFILLVNSQGKKTWMLTDDETVAAGDRIQCELVRAYAAFESTKHQMAFENLYLVKNLHHLSNDT